ncbi:MAG: histidine--tRNA ligase [Microthrixaceae bacterium]|nr:histidine--tRNA ligase [Microthrixaceae bacterium]MCO5312552.1 histidine--tRNA ligase [Microthrixaceae bacterium]
MAAPTFQSLKGMHDLVPPTSQRWLELISRFAEQFGRSAYRYIQTPILEELAVFARVGEGTDVVTKEMYDFTDRDGTHIALRPESTAGVARSVIQHRPLTPFKVWYFSQHFRHENTQAGRYRQHHQLGAECFGAAEPDVDVELIVGLWDFYRSLGLSQLRLELNSIGDPESRARYMDALRAFLNGRVGDLDPEDAAKIDRHPMRVLDSKRAATRAALDGVPTLMESMSEVALAHFDRVQQGLAAAGVPVTLNPRLVRGLDYYTHTVFEIISEAMDAAQSTIGGGGRYDGLVESLGGPPLPGVGFGSGIERILLACDREGVFETPELTVDAFVVELGGDGSHGRDLLLELRRGGVSCDRAYGGRSLRAQMKQADRSGARWGIIVGDDERAGGVVSLRDLRSSDHEGAQTTVPRGEIVDVLRRRVQIDAG